MAVRIRFSPVGKKKTPFYRVAVIDSRKKLTGESLENLGTYDGLKSKFVNFDVDRFNHWLGLGAKPSKTVEKVVKRYKKENTQAVG